MIQDVRSSSHPTWEVIAREVAAVTVTGLMAPLGLRRLDQRTPRRRAQRTTVLIHGYMANHQSLAPLAAWLRLRGAGPILSFDYTSSEGVERAAIALRAFLKARVRGGRIDLVCHSMGGLVARVYLQDLGGARRVDRCVTLGTPHQGTYSAYWLWSRVASELRPDSALMARLRETQAAAASVEFTSIIAASDNIVVPRVSAGHHREVVIDGVGHLSMLYSPTALKRVAEALGAPDASGPLARLKGWWARGARRVVAARPS